MDTFPKIIIVLVAIFIVLAGYYVFAELYRQAKVNQMPPVPLDIVLKGISTEEAIQLVREGKVKKVWYQKKFIDEWWALSEIILKDGKRFSVTNIKAILAAIEECGELCQDIEVIEE